MQAFNVIPSPESSKDSAQGDVCGPGNEVWVYEEKLLGWRENEMIYLIQGNSGDFKAKGRSGIASGAWIWKIMAIIREVQGYGEKYGQV
jgi:hypothetical protein